MERETGASFRIIGDFFAGGSLIFSGLINKVFSLVEDM